MRGLGATAFTEEHRGSQALSPGFTLGLGSSGRRPTSFKLASIRCQQHVGLCSQRDEGVGGPGARVRTV